MAGDVEADATGVIAARPGVGVDIRERTGIFSPNDHAICTEDHHIGKDAAS